MLEGNVGMNLDVIPALFSQEVDLQLKRMCEQFISDATNSLTQPLKSLLSKYDVIFQLAEKDSHDPATMLHHQPFAGAG